MKKWTFLLAAGLLAGATPVFTGCIDNDEPEGITILRGAKAELIKAKASVQQALAEQERAKVAIINAQAKQEEAKAKQEEAIAKQEEAEAARQQALADAQAARTEAEKAEAEARIAEAEVEIAEAEAEAKRVAAQLEIDLKNLQEELTRAEIAYQTALRDLTVAQNTLSEAQMTYLTPYINNVKTAKTTNETKAKDLKTATETYAATIAYLDREKAKESFLRAEKKRVASTEKAYNAAVVARDEAQKYATAELETANKWEAKLKELEAELEALDKAIADATVKRTEIEMASKGEFEQIKKLAEEFTKITGRKWAKEDDGSYELEAEPSIDSDPDEALKLEAEKITVEPGKGFPAIKEGVYKYDESEYKYSDYLKAIQEGEEFESNKHAWLKNMLEDIDSWRRSENDNKWTTEELAVYKEIQKENKKIVDEFAAWWSDATKAYMNGKADIDETAMPGYADLKSSVEAYNVAVKDYKDALGAEKEAKDALGLAEGQYAKDEAAIEKKKNDAINAAEDAYEKVVADADEKARQLSAAFVQANNELNEALAQLRLAKEQGDKEQIKALEALINDTEKDGVVVKKGLATLSSEAWKTYYDYRYTVKDGKNPYQTELNEGYALMQAEIDVANNTYYKEIFALTQKQGEYAQATEEAKTAWQTAYDALAAAGKAVDTKRDAANDNLQSFRNYPYVSNRIMPLDRTEANLDELAEITKQEMKEAVVELSNYLYGTDELDFSDNVYGDWNSETARLMKQEVEKEALKKYKELFGEDEMVYTNYYIYLLNQMGVMGQYTACEQWITLGESYLTNGKAIDELYAQVQTMLTDLDKVILANKTMVDDKEYALLEAVKALGEKFAEVDAELEQAEADKHAVLPVLDQVKEAIKTYLKYEEGTNGKTPETIDQLRDILTSIYESSVLAAETAYDEWVDAKEALADAEQASADVYALAEKNLKDAQEAATEAADKLAAAMEALKAAMERVAAEYDPSLEVSDK